MDFILVKDIDFESLLNREFNESVVKPNLTGNFGKCTILIKGNEGTIPHMHIEANDGSKVVMVRIMTPEYEVHKDPRQTAFNAKSVEAFNKLMHSEVYYKDKDVCTTYWDIARHQWLERCDETPKHVMEELRKMTEVPDYSLLPTKLPKKK